MGRKPSTERHPCTHPGCGKSFSRQDHLHRHMSNHLSVRPYECQRCNRLFSRQDVLNKHIARHNRRDIKAAEWSGTSAAASGSGAAAAAAAATASILYSTPAATLSLSSASASTSTGAQSTPGPAVEGGKGEDEEEDSNAEGEDDGAPASPQPAPPPAQTYGPPTPAAPTSHPTLQPQPPKPPPVPGRPGSTHTPSASSLRAHADPPTTPTTLVHPLFPPTAAQSQRIPPPNPKSSHAPAQPTASTQPTPFYPPYPPPPFAHPAPAPPAAPSTAQPQTDPSPQPPVPAPLPAQPQSQPHHLRSQPPLYPVLDHLYAATTPTQQYVPPGPPPPPPASASVPTRPTSFAPPPTAADAYTGALLDWLFDEGQAASGATGGGWDGSGGRASAAGAGFFRFGGGGGGGGEALQAPPAPSGAFAHPPPPPAPTSGSAPALAQPPPSAATDVPLDGYADPSTTVDDFMLMRIRNMLSSIPDLDTHPLYTTSTMSDALRLYWRFFHSRWPIIHRPTFNATLAPLTLVALMCVVGLHYNPLSEHDRCVAIAQRLRGLLLASDDFKPRVSVTDMQTLVLAGIYSQFMGNLESHDLSAAWCGFEQTLARRNSLFTGWRHPNQPAEGDLEGRWKAWADEEVMRRIAFCIFMRETEYASLCRQLPTRALSAFHIPISLPCDEYFFGLPTAELWTTAAPSIVPVQFPPALKKAFQGERPSPGPEQDINIFSESIILHGLMSISWDMQWRGTMGVVSQESGVANWRRYLQNAYDAWMNRLTKRAVAPDCPQLHAACDFHSLAQMESLTDIIALQVFAGMPVVGNQRITPAEAEASERLIRAWASSSDGCRAAWHAAAYLHGVLEYVLRAGSQRDPRNVSSHFELTIHLAALSLWAYTFCLSGARRAPPPPLTRSVIAPGTELQNLADAIAATERILVFTSLSTTSDPSSVGTLTCREGIATFPAVIQLMRRSRWETIHSFIALLEQLAGIPHDGDSLGTGALRYGTLGLAC